MYKEKTGGGNEKSVLQSELENENAVWKVLAKKHKTSVLTAEVQWLCLQKSLQRGQVVPRMAWCVS